MAPAPPAARTAKAGSGGRQGVPSEQHTREQAESCVEAALAAHNARAGGPDAAQRSFAGVKEALRFVELEAASEVQQELNMCQTTAVAHALTLMGHPTSVDDVITLVKVPIESAVGDGMTLAETHELALRYVERASLPVSVECYHFDELSGNTLAGFRTACIAAAAAGANDVLALNFHSGMAHGWPTGGGGHFSLMMGAVPASTRAQRELHAAMVDLGLDASSKAISELVERCSGPEGGALDLMMADVHPLKYGAFWSCPMEQMYAAMADRDSCGRSRGMLRFTATSERAHLQRSRSLGLQAVMKKGRAAVGTTCVSWAGSVPGGHPAFMLRRFIPPEWDSHIGTTNMGGMCALSLAINVVQGWVNGIDLEICMRQSRQSHVDHLRTFRTSESVAHAATLLASSRDMVNSKQALAVRHVRFGTTVASFREALTAARVDLGTTVLILPFDTNVARGGAHVVLGNTEAAKMSHGVKTWAAIASFNPAAADDDEQGVVLCSATSVTRDGRLWSTSVARLLAATSHGEVRDGGGVVIDWEMKTNQGQLDELFQLIDRDRDGKITAEELHASMVQMGLDPDLEEAKQLVEAFNVDADEASLTRDEAFNMFSKTLGMNPDQIHAGPRRQALLRKYMSSNGCVQNELGFATCHLALETADIPANVAFYNGVLGWPLYKTVDRAHAGEEEDTYGSSWASYGAFASFIVFHKEDTPIGRAGHGPWADKKRCPPELTPPADGGERALAGALPRTAGTISLDEIPYPCFGVVLEPTFFAKQMERAAAKSPGLRWMDVKGAAGALGGGMADRAVCFRDPDGWPLILFVSPLVGDEYTARHPAVPFVFCFEFRQSPSLAEDTRSIKRPITTAMTRELEKDQLRVTKHFYTDTLGAKLLSEDAVDGASRLQCEWCGHFLCMRSNRTYVPPALRENKATDSAHDMGANKGVVPMPHFGPNTSFINFDLIRSRVDTAMAQHGLPVEDLWCLARAGRAPPFNHIDPHNMLFPSDPDSCLSQFLTDPSGNAFEVKWCVRAPPLSCASTRRRPRPEASLTLRTRARAHAASTSMGPRVSRYLDFGEMFHHSGEIGVDHLVVDNSMVPDHFPPAVQALMQQRVRRGDAVGRDVEK